MGAYVAVFWLATAEEDGLRGFVEAVAALAEHSSVPLDVDGRWMSSGDFLAVENVNGG